MQIRIRSKIKSQKGQSRFVNLELRPIRPADGQIGPRDIFAWRPPEASPHGSLISRLILFGNGPREARGAFGYLKKLPSGLMRCK